MSSKATVPEPTVQRPRLENESVVRRTGQCVCVRCRCANRLSVQYRHTAQAKGTTRHCLRARCGARTPAPGRRAVYAEIRCIWYRRAVVDWRGGGGSASHPRDTATSGGICQCSATAAPAEATKVPRAAWQQHRREDNACADSPALQRLPLSADTAVAACCGTTRQIPEESPGLGASQELRRVHAHCVPFVRCLQLAHCTQCGAPTTLSATRGRRRTSHCMK